MQTRQLLSITNSRRLKRRRGKREVHKRKEVYRERKVEREGRMRDPTSQEENLIQETLSFQGLRVHPAREANHQVSSIRIQLVI